MTARTIMVQGTSSSVGKSIIATALCRLFAQEGASVAPFKAQNMALNAFATRDGGEIGRAQAVQATAARVVPTVDMNPILLKPEAPSRSQVVVLGKSRGSMSALDYQREKPALRGVVREALQRLRQKHDVVVIEGAGSPAEINLKDRDLVNMFVADAADAPVVLVGDIDRGGVFASFVGTLELLEPHERARVRALLINKFRGDARLLDSGLRFITEKTQTPVLGVVPHVPALQIADEDSVALGERRGRRRATLTELEIAVVLLPRISNYDDFLPLENEPGVVTRFVDNPRDLCGADLVILPGTKSTIADLEWLRRSGMATELVARARRAEPVLGICGGCQMLGRSILDPDHLESDASAAEGLALLPLTTRFGREKRTVQVQATVERPCYLGEPADPISGYHLHQGRISLDAGHAPLFSISPAVVDGACSEDGAVAGSMIHGLFDNASVRTSLLGFLRARRGLPSVAVTGSAPPIVDEYDRLASCVRENIDMQLLRRLVDG
jgi:adenosylcobyric acid synthase